MKTIEERAIQAADGYEDQAYSAGLYTGYKEGATEQKAIDIERVCDWLSNYFVFEHEGMTAQGCDAFLRKLRKDLEE